MENDAQSIDAGERIGLEVLLGQPTWTRAVNTPNFSNQDVSDHSPSQMSCRHNSLQGSTDSASFPPTVMLQCPEATSASKWSAAKSSNSNPRPKLYTHRVEAVVGKGHRAAPRMEQTRFPKKVYKRAKRESVTFHMKETDGGYKVLEVDGDMHALGCIAKYLENRESNARADEKSTAEKQQWAEAGQLKLSNLAQVLAFFRNRLLMLGQHSCKKIQVAIVDAICRNRKCRLPRPWLKQTDPATSTSDTSTSPQDVPAYWPKGVRYTGAHRLHKEERLAVLQHLFALPLLDPKQCRLIISGKTYGKQWDSWGRLLESAMNPELELHDRYRYGGDEENSDRRHLARVDLVQELVLVATKAEKYANRELSDDYQLAYSAVSKDILSKRTGPMSPRLEPSVHAISTVEPKSPDGSNAIAHVVDPQANAGKAFLTPVADDARNLDYLDSQPSSGTSSLSTWNRGTAEAREGADYATPMMDAEQNEIGDEAQPGSATSSLDAGMSEFKVVEKDENYMQYTQPLHTCANLLSNGLVGHDGITACSDVFGPMLGQGFTQITNAKPQKRPLQDLAQIDSYDFTGSSRMPDEAEADRMNAASRTALGLRRSQSVWPPEGVPTSYIDCGHVRDDQSVLRNIPSETSLRWVRGHYSPVLGPQHFVTTPPSQLLCNPQRIFASEIDPNQPAVQPAFPFHIYENIASPPPYFQNGFWSNGAPRGYLQEQSWQ